MLKAFIIIGWYVHVVMWCMPVLSSATEHVPFHIEEQVAPAEKSAEQSIRPIIQMSRQQADQHANELQLLTEKNAAQSMLIIVFSISTMIAFIVMIFQYTKVSKLNRRMALHEQELDKLNNMKNKLFSIIGHDLRAPLAKICTVLDLYDDDEDVFTPQEKRRSSMTLKVIQKLPVIPWTKCCTGANR